VRLAVCWKWVSLDREHEPDQRWAGVSAADEAALETALALSDDVTVVCLGPADADDTLRGAIAVGARQVVRIDASTELEGRTVATAIAEHLGGVDVVLCGDYSVDRGTGSVPAFLAAELGAAQALGLVDVDVRRNVHPNDDRNDEQAPIRVVRRLDGGRREVLDVPLPAVLSVEGSVARLRRAPLAAELASRSATIPSVRGPHGRLPEPEIHPYRPRPRTLPAPAGDTLARVRAILDVGGADAHAETVTLAPADAAHRILDQLREWGYLDESDA
jgi:electron transfer flavoprotein beta subunit